MSSTINTIIEFLDWAILSILHHSIIPIVAYSITLSYQFYCQLRHKLRQSYPSHNDPESLGISNSNTFGYATPARLHWGAIKLNGTVYYARPLYQDVEPYSYWPKESESARQASLGTGPYPYIPTTGWEWVRATWAYQIHHGRLFDPEDDYDGLEDNQALCIASR